MPEFVMPEPQVAAPAPPSPRAPDREPARALDPTAEPPDPAELPVHHRAPWRHLLAAGLVGVLVGAGLPAAMQGVDQAAADARVASLRQLTTDYLAAIAAGDAARATAMVPTTGGTEVAEDAVLRSADRIEEPAVRLLTIDGDAATVEVRFDLGRRPFTRSLAAAWADGAWQLTTSLAEPAMVYSYEAYGAGMSSSISVGGVLLPSNRRLLLYPGQYVVDTVENELFRSGGDAFEVDGDPATPTEIFSSATVSSSLAREARALAAARVEACQQAGDCPIDPSALDRAQDDAYLMGFDLAAGVVDLVVPLGQEPGFGGLWHELQLRAHVDEAGALVSWECGRVGLPHNELEPCET